MWTQNDVHSKKHVDVKAYVSQGRPKIASKTPAAEGQAWDRFCLSTNSAGTLIQTAGLQGSTLLLPKPVSLWNFVMVALASQHTALHERRAR